MPNIAVVFKQEISRLARKEVRSRTQGLHKTSAQHRRDIAELKRHASRLQSVVARLERQLHKGASPPMPEADAEGIRFTAKGVRSQRKRLGISAAAYARLAGVTAHTIYKWEHGAARPRKRQLAVLASLRTLGKRAARARLQQRGAERSRRNKTR